LFLIGANNSGKSSILQALAFTQYFAQGKSRSFFEDRGWNRQDIRSRTGQGRAGALALDLLLESNATEQIVWKFTWGLVSARPIAESIWVRNSRDTLPRRILHYTRARDRRSKRTSPLQGLKPEGSVLAVLEPEAFAPGDETILKEVLRWGLGVSSLELLSPVAMRRGFRGEADDIGPRGERLAGFIAGLNARTKNDLIERLSRFYKIENIETTRKRAGWVDLRVAEEFARVGSTPAAHISDGFLRLLALSTIPEFDESIGLVLLDEVEDGIEPHILPKFIQSIARESKAQLILSSHSPLLINFFEPDEICLLSRSPKGHTVAARLSDLKIFKTGSEYLGSGEIWANTDLKEITRETTSIHRKSTPAQLNSLEDVAAFMDFK